MGPVVPVGLVVGAAMRQVRFMLRPSIGFHAVRMSDRTSREAMFTSVRR